MLSLSAIEWLKLHEFELEDFAFNEFSDEVDIIEFKNWCFKNPHTAYQIIKQSMLQDDEKIDALIDKIKDKRGLILLVVGQKGAGKSCFAYWLTKKLHDKGENIWFFGPPVDMPEFIDNWTFNLDLIPQDTTVILEEASVQYSARFSMKNQDLISKLPVLRHSGKNFIVICQNSASIDLNFLRLCMPLNTKIRTINGIKSLHELKNNDYVSSYNFKKNKVEQKPIIIHEPSLKETICIILENNKSIECSPDHLFYTENGLKAAKELTANDKLYIV